MELAYFTVGTILIIVTIFIWMYISSLKSTIHSLNSTIQSLNNTIHYLKNTIQKNEKNKAEYIQKRQEELNVLLSNKKTVMPYIAGMISDYMTLEYDWASYYLSNKTRPAFKEAKRIQELKNDTKQLLAEYKIYEYQLNYLLERFPALSDILEDEEFSVEEIAYESHDPIRNFLSQDEWKNLSNTSKNQLALERYLKRRTNTQIGRDYELYIGQLYERLGYSVEYTGMENGYYDRGRDIIVKQNSHIIIVQCKYRGKKKDGTEKEIHENSITQLFGTLTRYSIENNLQKGAINACLITNKTLDKDAKKCASYLGIAYRENMEMLDFPQIKYNISKAGEKIYHLPMDQQYDKVKINQPGECYAYTVAEAEQKGFRRAFRYAGNFSQSQ